MHSKEPFNANNLRKSHKICCFIQQYLVNKKSFVIDDDQIWKSHIIVVSNI